MNRQFLFIGIIILASFLPFAAKADYRNGAETLCTSNNMPPPTGGPWQEIIRTDPVSGEKIPTGCYSQLKCDAMQGVPNPKPYYMAQNNCIIERQDTTSDADLCRRGLLGTSLPLPSANIVGPYLQVDSPSCIKFCFFTEDYIQKNPPPWPVDSPNNMGTRPSYNNKQPVMCPRDPATGDWLLGPAKVLPKKTQCRYVQNPNQPNKCRIGCQIFEYRNDFTKGMDYRNQPQWVEVSQSIRNIQIVNNTMIKELPNPLIDCPAGYGK